MSNPLADMSKPDVIFCIGTNMTECHPVAATGLKKALARGAKMIVADPRRIKLAELADLYLPIRVGSDVALLLAMSHVIIREGLVDQKFVEERTAEYEAFAAHTKQFTPEWAATICEVNAADIEKAAIIYGKGTPSAIYYTLGITEHICGVDNVQSLCNLALMTGNLGVEGAGINPMRGQNNIQGTGDNGAETNIYPGYDRVDDPEVHEKWKKFYGREDLDLGQQKTKVTALQECGTEIRAMLIDGENTVVTDPDRKHCEHALKSLDHLVVIDLFMTETAQMANIVLPATGFAETDGVACNTERRVQRLRAAVKPPGIAKPDWWIVSEIAKRTGFQGFDHFQSAKDVFNELCSIASNYAGLDWDRIENESLNWPVPTKDHPGTPILHQDSFKNGRGLFKVISYRDPAEVIDDDYPLWLTTGRRLQSYHSRTQTGRAEGIDYLLPEEALEIHPHDLARLGFQDGDRALIASRRGEIEIKLRATTKSPKGTVFASFAFDQTPINILTGSGYDPVTMTAELKVCPVRLRPIP
jgi:formate dehydrogenase major subunit